LFSPLDKGREQCLWCATNILKDLEYSMTQKTQTKQRRPIYRQGYFVAFALAVLTIVEYYAALFIPSAILLFLLAIFKAALVLNYFMHISSLWSPGEEH
jgi:cytochrome c oxidase subunit 4